MKRLNNNPPKGTYDWFPEEFEIRKYIFDRYRDVCTRFGYREYLTPLFESADIYRAKSGEDIGGKELMTFTDKAEREYALRPEMTPSVTRMVSRIYDGEPKPLRLFSIANFVRNEKPQKGRNREFWQLNFDIFGTRSLNADIEIAQMTEAIMQEFNPPSGSYSIYINHRKLIDFVLDQLAQIEDKLKLEVVRILDKFDKLTAVQFASRLKEVGINQGQQQTLLDFMQANSGEELIEKLPEVSNSEGYKETEEILAALSAMGIADNFQFKPNVIRGFDYYDGMVLEVFDNNDNNNRSLFGGGRYDGLGKIYGIDDMPATGVAPGDETMRIFLENWGLIDQVKRNRANSYYAPLLSENEDVLLARDKIATELRDKGEIVEEGLDIQRLGKALDYANKRQLTHVIILDEREIEEGEYKIKNMSTGAEKSVKIN
jgi:histidyl-tRNA synthetase